MLQNDPSYSGRKAFPWGKVAFVRNEQMTDEGRYSGETAQNRFILPHCVRGLLSSASHKVPGTFPQGKA